MKLFYATLLLGFTSFVSAQNKIVGTTSDKDNKPLPSVNISIPEIHKETISDANGKYALNNLPKGNFTIVFSSIGYTTKSLTTTITNKETTLNVALEDNVIHMDEVIVSTVFNKLQSQNVMKVEHESVKSLQQRGATTLAEGLATIPGVSQISTGVSIGKPVIRGLSANRVLVYSQGVRLENQAFGDEHGLGLNDAGIESVEVIKGPASLLYGSDALGGVLYFIPEKFAKANTFGLDLGQKYFSNTLGSSTNIGFKTSGDRFKFLARVSNTLHSDYKIPNGDRVTNTRYKELDFKTGIGYSDKNFSSEFRYNYNRLLLGIPRGGIAAQTTVKDPDYPRQAVYNQLLSLNNTVFLGSSKLDLNVGYIYNDRTEFPESATPGSSWHLKTLNYDAKYHLPSTDKFETIIGVQGMHQTNLNVGTEYLIPDATTKDIGAFGTTRYEIGNNVFQAGIRYDTRKVNGIEHGTFGNEGYLAAIDRKFDSFNASLGYKRDLSKTVILRLNLASGFRAPNIFELSSNGVHDGTIRYEIGNPNLKSEQNFQTDLNLEYNSSHFELFVNGFYNKINNYIFISPNGNVINDFNVFDYLQNNANLYGGEVGIHFHPHPLDWLHITSSFESVTGKKQDGSNLPLIPANKWTNTVRVDFKSNKTFKDIFALANVEHTLNQNSPSEFETKSNDYTLVNMGIGGKVILGKTSFNVNLNANNLLNKTYIAHLSRLKNDGIPNIGRSVVLGINFTI